MIDTGSPFDFHTIETFDGSIYATGGNVWTKSYLTSSADSKQWLVDSLTNKSVFDLYATDTMLYGVGNDGYIFSGQPELKLTRTKHWGLLRAFTAAKIGFVAVGGKDFNKGWIYKVNEELKIDTTYIFENEILDVSCNQEGICVACGYGIIIQSNDNGYSWKRIDETGDYYNSITINAKNEFYIVGYNGSILTSVDNGTTWEKLKNGHSPLSDNKPFRTIKFNNNVGVIAGDNGLLWYSEDHGQNWKDMSIDIELDLFDFVFYQNILIAASEKGILYKVSL
ncbi:MAG: YCF48-related protein [Saprospiraceae bacterium]|nr:YCF48-related protein [Saprospiraceae bacterium]